MSVQDDIRKLTEIKRKLDAAKDEVARLEGELRANQKRAEDAFGTDDPTELRSKAEAFRLRAASILGEVERGLKAIEKEMDEALPAEVR